jgi:hypothetical protein
VQPINKLWVTRGLTRQAASISRVTMTATTVTITITTTMRKTADMRNLVLLTSALLAGCTATAATAPEHSLSVDKVVLTKATRSTCDAKGTVTNTGPDTISYGQLTFQFTDKHGNLTGSETTALDLLELPAGQSSTFWLPYRCAEGGTDYTITATASGEAVRVTA